MKKCAFSGNEYLHELLSPGNGQKLKSYLEGRDLLDLVRDIGPWSASAQEFVSILRKIPSTTYIRLQAALSANPDEVHLTIGAVRYDAHGRERKGVSSIFTQNVCNLGIQCQFIFSITKI